MRTFKRLMGLCSVLVGMMGLLMVSPQRSQAQSTFTYDLYTDFEATGGSGPYATYVKLGYNNANVNLWTGFQEEADAWMEVFTGKYVDEGDDVPFITGAIAP